MGRFVPGLLERIKLHGNYQVTLEFEDAELKNWLKSHIAEKPDTRAHAPTPSGPPLFLPAVSRPAADLMREKERLKLLETVSEAHAALSAAARALRRRLSLKAPTTQAARAASRSTSSGYGAASFPVRRPEKALGTAPEVRMGR